MKKIILVLSIIFLFSGCTNYKTLQKSAFTNDEFISSDGDSYTYYIRAASSKMDEVNQYSLTFQKFSGTDTLFKISSDGKKELSLNIDLTTNTGDLKLVLIDPSDNVSTIAIGTQSLNRSYLLNKGAYRLKLVGRDTSGKLELKINNSELFKINKRD